RNSIDSSSFNLVLGGRVVDRSADRTVAPTGGAVGDSNSDRRSGRRHWHRPAERSAKLVTLQQWPELAEQDRDQQVGEAQDHQQRSPTPQRLSLGQTTHLRE